MWKNFDLYSLFSLFFSKSSRYRELRFWIYIIRWPSVSSLDSFNLFNYRSNVIWEELNWSLTLRISLEAYLLRYSPSLKVEIERWDDVGEGEYYGGLGGYNILIEG